MRASTVRRLCTLSNLFRSHSYRPKPECNIVSFEPSCSESEDNFGSELSALDCYPSPGDSWNEDAAAAQLPSIMCPPSAKGKGEVIPFLPELSPDERVKKRIEASRERKSKFIYKYALNERFDRLVKICGNKLGTGTMLDVFSHLGRETGVKEYSAMIKSCIKKARAAKCEYTSGEEMNKAFLLFRRMREEGFQLEEQTYYPLLQYIIDMGMVREFQLFSDVIKADNPGSIPQLGYYEMKLWIRVNDEGMIRDICEYITVEDSEETSALRESYLLALCESDREMQILDVLKNIDITKLSSTESIANVFQALGRLLLESVAENLLLNLTAHDQDADDVSNFIACYAVSIPNLTVEDIISKIKNLHELLEVVPSPSAYARLISYCCDLHEMNVALNIVEMMCEAGFALSKEMLQFILQTCAETYEYILVHRIFSVIRRYNLGLNGEICRCLVHFCVRGKDFEGAYKMIDDLKEMKFIPTAGMYNAIMAGYFREKNINGGLRVLKHMQGANVKPDSQTFMYLISNCSTEEDIIKYCEEMQCSGVPATKQIYMAIINAYAACGKLDKAKEVLLDSNISKFSNEIKSVLVSALASHGQLSDALLMYEEIKKAGHILEPKAVISLIEEFTQFNGELDGMLVLLTELRDIDYWVDGCFRVIMYCVRTKNLSSAITLFKQLKDKFEGDEIVMEALFDSVFSLIAELQSAHLQIGLDLLLAIKHELGLVPSRQCLDFLLSACASAGDLNNSRLIWREYEAAGFPYNVLSYLRMYQALMAAGDYRSAKLMLKKIPKDDPEVRSIIIACQETYYDKAINSVVVKKKKKKKGKKEKET